MLSWIYGSFWPFLSFLPLEGLQSSTWCVLTNMVTKGERAGEEMRSLELACTYTVCGLSCVQFLVTPWFIRLLWPWNFPGKNAEVSCRFLLQGSFLMQGSNLSLLYLLHWEMGSFPQRPWKALYTHLLMLLFSRPAVSDSSRPHGPQHPRPPCPSPSPGVYPSSCSLHWCCHPVVSSSDALFSSCPESSPTSGTFPMSRLFASDDQTPGASTSVSVTLHCIENNQQGPTV